MSDNTVVTITAAVTFSGNGTTAKIGTSQTANRTTTTLVRNVVGLPPAEEPAITINVIPDGAEHTEVTLGINAGRRHLRRRPHVLVVGYRRQHRQRAGNNDAPVETPGGKLGHQLPDKS